MSADADTGVLAGGIRELPTGVSSSESRRSSYRAVLAQRIKVSIILGKRNDPLQSNIFRLLKFGNFAV